MKQIDLRARLDYAVRVHWVVDVMEADEGSMALLNVSTGKTKYGRKVYIAKCGAKGVFLRECLPKDEPKCPRCFVS